MRRNQVILILCIVALLGLFFWGRQKHALFQYNPAAGNQTNRTASNQNTPATNARGVRQMPVSYSFPTQSPPSAETIAALERAITTALNTPITFYGRVVDQSNQPVPEAKAYFNAADKFGGPGTDYQRISDANGYFSITGIHGSDLGVGVGKDGYYSRDQSHAYFNFGNGPHGKNLPPPARDNPAVFVLVKMGETEPLIKVSSRQFDLLRLAQ